MVSQLELIATEVLGKVRRQTPEKSDTRGNTSGLPSPANLPPAGPANYRGAKRQGTCIPSLLRCLPSKENVQSPCQLNRACLFPTANTCAMSAASSQLSSHDSEEFGEDVKMEDADEAVDNLPDQFAPPSKKRRTGRYSHQSTPAPLAEESNEDLGYISEDTDGSIPNSPIEDRSRTSEDDPFNHEQVTFCKWLDCDAGELGNMDNLVQHLHDVHVAGKQANYACDWIGCSRQGQPHASGYALKAHLRSHTKEKPFYCALPGKESNL